MAWRRSSVRARQGPPSKYLVLDTIRVEDFFFDLHRAFLKYCDCIRTWNLIILKIKIVVNLIRVIVSTVLNIFHHI